jgi:hypothetical protein
VIPAGALDGASTVESNSVPTNSGLPSIEVAYRTQLSPSRRSLSPTLWLPRLNDVSCEPPQVYRHRPLAISPRDDLDVCWLRSWLRFPRSREPCAADDLTRVAELVEQYVLLGTTVARVVALAERLSITEIVTLDRRHFNVVRPRHTEPLILSP